MGWVTDCCVCVGRFCLLIACVVRLCVVFMLVCFVCCLFGCCVLFDSCCLCSVVGFGLICGVILVLCLLS